MDPRNILLPTSADFASGIRIALMPDGRATPAGENDCGIGISGTNSAGGRVIVRLNHPAQKRKVVGPIHAGGGLVNADGGLLVAGRASPDAIALAPVPALAQAEISVMPVRRGSALPRSVTDSPAPAQASRVAPRSHSPAPAAAGPARKAAMFSNPIAVVYKRRSRLIAAGITPDAAMAQVFAEDGALHASYARAIRADSTALAKGIAVEVNRLVAEKMEAGMIKADATFDVWRRDPDLRQRFVASQNGTPRASTPTPAQALHTKRELEMEIHRRIGPLKAKGVSHAEAVARVYAADPQLQQAYVAAANAGNTIPR